MSIVNTRATYGAMLGTVQTTAQTVTDTLSTVNNAVGMLNKVVTDAADRQKIRSKLDMAIFAKTLHQEKAQELAQSRLNMRSFMEMSVEHAAEYQKSFDELASLMAD